MRQTLSVVPGNTQSEYGRMNHDLQPAQSYGVCGRDPPEAPVMVMCNVTRNTVQRLCQLNQWVNDPHDTQSPFFSAIKAESWPESFVFFILFCLLSIELFYFHAPFKYYRKYKETFKHCKYHCVFTPYLTFFNSFIKTNYHLYCFTYEPVVSFTDHQNSLQQ